MAGALYKKEIIIRESSTITLERAIEVTTKWLDKFYKGANLIEFPKNISDELLAVLSTAVQSSGNRNYSKELDGTGELNYYFAEIFDSREGAIYKSIRVYHPACVKFLGVGSKLVHYMVKAPEPEYDHTVILQRLERIESQIEVYGSSLKAVQQEVAVVDLTNMVSKKELSASVTTRANEILAGIQTDFDLLNNSQLTNAELQTGLKATRAYIDIEIERVEASMNMIVEITNASKETTHLLDMDFPLEELPV